VLLLPVPFVTWTYAWVVPLVERGTTFGLATRPPVVAPVLRLTVRVIGAAPPVGVRVMVAGFACPGK
jgi:hypothetical protein